MKHWWFAMFIACLAVSPAMAVTDEEYVAEFKAEAMAETPEAAIEEVLRQHKPDVSKHLRKRFSTRSYKNKSGKRCYPGLNVPCGYQF